LPSWIACSSFFSSCPPSILMVSDHDASPMLLSSWPRAHGPRIVQY
jgi:hypothetical protein